MKDLLVRGALSAAAVILSCSAYGQAYAAKPVRFVVPFVPGGPTDIQGRMLGEKLGQRLGQQVIIDNRGGAGGNIAAKLVAAEFSTYVKAEVAQWAQIVKTAGVTSD
jgi:tripartite-type tricarboxylate transporter receptor subunit TctC